MYILHLMLDIKEGDIHLDNFSNTKIQLIVLIYQRNTYIITIRISRLFIVLRFIAYQRILRVDIILGAEKIPIVEENVSLCLLM